MKLCSIFLTELCCRLAWPHPRFVENLVCAGVPDSIEGIKKELAQRPCVAFSQQVRQRFECHLSRGTLGSIGEADFNDKGIAAVDSGRPCRRRVELTRHLLVQAFED